MLLKRRSRSFIGRVLDKWPGKKLFERTKSGESKRRWRRSEHTRKRNAIEKRKTEFVPKQVGSKKMPAGVSWTRYLTYTGVAMLTMLAGSQTVHHFYRPLDDLDMLIEQEYEKLLKQEKEKS
ncbi:uncharacterized protein LOC124307854 [Neodiprion virginianus]|uniref:uncharacterized protein LOC124307854 n=1 Tax=Neodiprion virginianus TaxID=2961670 RepID=UPI00076FA678|nr:uncharacterized protein LOC124307854 [Neodiprion virginianus]